MVIEYPAKINRLPKTDGLDSMLSIFVDVLALKFTPNIDETIRNIRADYQDVLTMTAFDLLQANLLSPPILFLPPSWNSSTWK